MKLIPWIRTQVKPFFGSAFHRTISLLVPLGLAIVTTPAWSHTATIGIEYDPAGRVEQLIHPNQKPEMFTYNGLDVQDTVRYGLIDVVTSTLYTPSGRIQERLISSDIGGPGATEMRSYDALGRLTEQRIDVGSETYHASQITYHEMGYVDTLHRNDNLLANTSVDYNYTIQGQLASFHLEGASAAQSDYLYDQQGNLLSRSGLAHGSLSLAPYAAAGAFDERNRINAPGWTYDNAGRLTADRDFLYAYNRAGRLALVTDRSGNLVAHYLYDANGLRVRKLTETTVTYYYRDPEGAVIAETTYDLENQEQVVSQRDYIRHNGDNVMTAFAGDQAGFEGQLTDRLGNPVVRWKDDTVALQEYSPFGQQMHQNTASIHDGPYDYTGHEKDAETRQIYMRARYYDPQSARFGRPDPARDFDPFRSVSYNLYQYVGNNPIYSVDPSGEFGDPVDPGVSVEAKVAIPGLISAAFSIKLELFRSGKVAQTFSFHGEASFQLADVLPFGGNIVNTLDASSGEHKAAGLNMQFAGGLGSGEAKYTKTGPPPQGYDYTAKIQKGVVALDNKGNVDTVFGSDALTLIKGEIRGSKTRTVDIMARLEKDLSIFRSPVDPFKYSNVTEFDWSFIRTKP